MSTPRPPWPPDGCFLSATERASGVTGVKVDVACAAAKTTRPTDVVLLSTEWPSRALLRAQLIEEGLEVAATDTWTMMRRHLGPGSKPRFAIVDLRGLKDPERVLNDLRILIKPDHVLVLTAIDTVSLGAIEQLGFRILKRPLSIGRVVAAVVRALKEQGTSGQSRP